MKIDFRQKFQRFGTRIIDGVILAFFAFCAISFAVCAVKYGISYPQLFRFWEIIYLVPVACCLVVLFMVIRRSMSLHSWKFVLLWSLYFLIQSIAIILLLQSPPKGDGGGIYKEALRLFNGGEFVMDSSNYYYKCYWLMGTVYFEKLLMSVIGTSYTAFKLLGTLMLLGAGICLYKIAKDFVDDKTGKVVFSMYVLFAPITLNVSHFSHQHIAFFLLMVSIVLLEKPTWPRGLLAGILIGLMNAFRPWGILVILSLACFGIYKLITAPKESKRLKWIIFAAAFLVAYFSAGKVIDTVLVHAGYIDREVSEGQSMVLIKIDRGIDPDMDTFGKQVDEKVKGTAGEEYNEARKPYYVARLKELLVSRKPYVYVAGKMFRMFGSVDYWFENCFEDKLHIYDFPVRLVYFFNWFQYIFLLVIGALGYWQYRKKYTFNLLMVFTIGYILAHLFIEAFSSYRICVYPLLLIYGAYFVKGFMGKNGPKSIKLTEKEEKN